MPRLPDMSRLPIRDKLWLPDALRCGGVGNCQSAPDGHNALLRDMDRLSLFFAGACGEEPQAEGAFQIV